MPTFRSANEFETFRRAVRFDRRFAHDSESMEFLDAVRQSARSRLLTLRRGHPLWRAVIGHGTAKEWIPASEDDDPANGFTVDVDGPLAPERMIPDHRLVADGRLNPRGIAYLYLAEDEETAIAEVRPWLGASVSVGKFEVLRDLDVVDCSTPKSSLSLFRLSADGPVPPPESEWDDLVWGRISHAFAQPTDPHDSDLTYAATQILAEVLREEGHDGVVYQSAMRKAGKNVALFDVSSARWYECYLNRVDSIEYFSGTSGHGYSRPRETETPIADAGGPPPSGV